MYQITLTQGQVTVIDRDTYRSVGHSKWYAKFDPGSKCYYAVRHIKTEAGKRGLEYLHRRILNAPKGSLVDHINGDTLDNQRQNLRLVDNRTNQQNRWDHRAGKLPGTMYHKGAKKWRARIEVKGKQIHLGLFATEQEAHARYMAAVKTVRS